MKKKEEVKLEIVHKRDKMLTTSEFIKLSGVSEASVTRLKNKVKEDFMTRSLIYYNGPNVYMDRKLLGTVIPPHFIGLDKEKYPEYYKENNDIKERYIDFLKRMTWDIIGAVNYEKNMSSNACSDRMYKLEKQLKKKYPTSIITLFFINELNTLGLGYHTHFVLRVSAHGAISELKSFIENKLRGKRKTANTLLESYDPNKSGIEYIMKYFNNNRDGYDYLGSDVSEQRNEPNIAA